MSREESVEVMEGEEEQRGRIEGASSPKPAIHQSYHDHVKGGSCLWQRVKVESPSGATQCEANNVHTS